MKILKYLVLLLVCLQTHASITGLFLRRHRNIFPLIEKTLPRNIVRIHYTLSHSGEGLCDRLVGALRRGGHDATFVERVFSLTENYSRYSGRSLNADSNQDSNLRKMIIGNRLIDAVIIFSDTNDFSQLICVIEEIFHDEMFPRVAAYKWLLSSSKGLENLIEKFKLAQQSEPSEEIFSYQVKLESDLQNIKDVIQVLYNNMKEELELLEGVNSEIY